MYSDEPIITPTTKQAQFGYDALMGALKGTHSFMLYGGAIRGGKTYVVLSVVFALCRMFEGSRWAIVRKDLPTLKRNLMPTFNNLKPEFVGDINKSNWEATCANGSKILFFPESLKDDPNGDRFRGLEVNGFILEEANELSEQTFYRCMERAGTWTHAKSKNDLQPNPLIMLTCNPALGWVKSLFYNPWKTGTLLSPYYYLPARADDNPHIPESVRESWKNLPEKDYKRFVEGDWDVADDPDQLIRFEWLTGAYNVEAEPGVQRMGIDVARFGDDKTVFCYLTGNELVEFEEFDGLSIDRTSSFAQARISERGIGANNVGVDVVGLGAGVADNLRSMGYEVKDIVSGAAPVVVPMELDTLYTFKNLRSQMWWSLREELRKGELSLSVRDQRLIDDLLSVRYKMSADKSIQVESKDDIKKRLGRSTDYGDAFVYAAFVDKIDVISPEIIVV